MVRPAILVSKLGCAFRSRPVVDSPSGEVGGQTEGAMRALVAAGFRVVYFGRWIGPEVPNVTVVEPTVLGKGMTAEEQEEGFVADAAALEPHLPFSFALYASGPPMSSFLVRNERGARVQDSACRFLAPQMHAIRRFGLRLAVALVDPVQRPRHVEMSVCWPETRPVAVIGHGYDDRRMTVGWKDYLVRSVWGATETWNYDEPMERPKSIAAVCVAHAHVEQHVGECVPQSAWEALLGGGSFAVYGSGWEHFLGYSSVRFPGPLPPYSARLALAQACVCPVLAHTKGWFGTKQWFCTNVGCVPLSYGRDPSLPCCWDPGERYLPMDHWSRVTSGREVEELGRKFLEGGQVLVMEEMRSIFKPNFSKLVDLASDMEAGLPEDGLWFHRWGGYKPCG